MKIVRLIIGVCTSVLLAACGTAAILTIDDAYYWSDNTSEPTETTSTTETTQTTSTTEPTPTLEYTNIQDTTITVKIKR